MPSSLPADGNRLHTRIIAVDPKKCGHLSLDDYRNAIRESMVLPEDALHDPAIEEAALLLQQSDIPVAFPTETVYGLGADATRSDAVKGIFKAKSRPSDNPLIVHIASLDQLRGLLQGHGSSTKGGHDDAIPSIYIPLIQRFWPGPLTIILPLPNPSPFAPEVTATLSTFGARMPASLLALALITAAGVPLAAPSANTSTKPSPTRASHVMDDLQGGIEMILDGGACEIGLESTVVNGLVDPPVILRPGAISLEMLRTFPQWSRVQVGYKDMAETEIPRAPGMKYKHYSPKAHVVLVHGDIKRSLIEQYAKDFSSAGILWTGGFPLPQKILGILHGPYQDKSTEELANIQGLLGPAGMIRTNTVIHNVKTEHSVVSCYASIGPNVSDVANALFATFRDFDKKGVQVLFVECIDENIEGSAAAAVLNRMRKAASIEIDGR